MVNLIWFNQVNLVKVHRVLFTSSVEVKVFILLAMRQAVLSNGALAALIPHMNRTWQKLKITAFSDVGKFLTMWFQWSFSNFSIPIGFWCI